MSIKAMNWAWGQTIKSGPKFVLIALADHADNEGRCWPGQEGIAEKCCMDRSTINQHLGKLAKLGLITARKRADEHGHRLPNMYVLNLNVHIQADPSEKIQSSNDSGVNVGNSNVGNSNVGKTNVGKTHVGITPPQSWDSQHKPPITVKTTNTPLVSPPPVQPLASQAATPAAEGQVPNKEPEQTTTTAAPTQGTKPSRKPKAEARPIPGNWHPSDNTLALLAKTGIPNDFTLSQVPEFVVFWLNAGKKRPGWEATFINRVKSQWSYQGAREQAAKVRPLRRTLPQLGDGTKRNYRDGATPDHELDRLIAEMEAGR